jgi:hypothetical protein
MVCFAGGLALIQRRVRGFLSTYEASARFQHHLQISRRVPQGFDTDTDVDATPK